MFFNAFIVEELFIVFRLFMWNLLGLIAKVRHGYVVFFVLFSNELYPVKMSIKKYHYVC